MAKRFLAICCLLCLAFGVSGQANEGIRFIEGEKWENVLQMAQQQNKHIFMDCYTVWCGPCKALAKNIFTRKDVGDFFNEHFINVKYDMEKGEGKMLNKRYKENIIGFPTLLLIDKEGKVVHQMAGFQEADVLIAGMKSGMEGKSLFGYRDRYNAGERDLAFLKDYVQALNGAFLKDDIEKLMADYMKNLPVEKLQEKEIWDFVSPYIKNPYSPHFDYVISNMITLNRKVKLDRYAVEWQLSWELDKAVKEIIGLKKDKEEKILPFTDQTDKLDTLKRLIDKAGFAGAEGQRLKMKIYQFELEKNWDKVFEYLMVGRDIMRASENYVDEVFQYMATYCTDMELLKKCLVVVEEMQANEKNKSLAGIQANYYDTLSMLYNRLGDKSKAKEYQTKYDEARKEVEKKFKEFLKGNK